MAERELDRDELERKFGGARRPVRFPPGEVVLPRMPFRPELLEEIDRLLLRGRCPEGRLEITAGEARLTCLIHSSAPFVAGLAEGEVFSRVPLADFTVRARQLHEARCSLTRTDAIEVMLVAVHFCQRPDLQGSTELVDPAHVLDHLARQRQDAAIALERSGHRTLVFLDEGRPAELYFGDPADDPGEGDLEDRLLLYAFAPSSASCRIEVFTRLRVEPDADAGSALVELDRAAQPPPPADVVVQLPDGREVRRRPFTPPAMIVGRDPTVDLFIDNLAVSRKHARLSWERGRFVIEDLGSANGTAVNGQAVNRAALAAGDRIAVGKFTLTIFEYEAFPSMSQTLLMPTVGESPPPGYLTTDSGVTRLDRDVLIGRGDEVDLQAAGLWVRSVHARVSFEDGERFLLVCFGGARARVNGRKVARADLEFGDRIRIGSSEYRLVESAVERPR